MKPLLTLIAVALAAVALIACGSSSDDGSSSPATTATQAPSSSSSSQDQAASTVCAARADIQTQVESLGSGSPSRIEITTALAAIQSDLQKMKSAQADLAPDRKQQVQDASAAFEAKLKTIASQIISGLTKSDAKTQVADAVASLKSAVTEALQPIEC
jgi:hypothetical protein